MVNTQRIPLQESLDGLSGGSSIAINHGNEAVSILRDKKILQSADALPFDQLAKLSAEGTLALGAVPAATICAIIFGLALLALLKFVVTRSSMGLAMRAPDARDIFV